MEVDKMTIGSSSVTSYGSWVSYHIVPESYELNCGSTIVAASANGDFTLGDCVEAAIHENILSLTSNEASSPHLLKVGNKSINQLKLWHRGFLIPHTVFLDFSFYHTFKKTGEVDLRTVYEAHIADKLGPSLAIRCSSNLEDGEEKSFAGVFDTYLNVPNEYAVFREKVLQSFRRFSTIDDIPLDLRRYDIHLGIMVQKMVKARFSGFLFTTHPMNPPNNWLKIEYWQGEREQSEGFSLTLNSLDGKRIRSAQENSKISLPKAAQNELYSAANDLGEYFGFPQDAEFLICEEEESLYLVQSRPITAFSYSPDKVRHKEKEKLSELLSKNTALYQKDPILSNSNISELFVRAIPLGYSIFKHGFAGTQDQQGGISIGRSRLGYAELDLEDQVNLFYTVGDQARVNIIVDALTFRLPGISKADYLNYFVRHYLEKVKEDPNAAIYPENGLYLQFDNSERWSEIAREKGSIYQKEYSDFLAQLIGYHAPKEYAQAKNFFEENERFYREYLKHDLRSLSEGALKGEIIKILGYLRTKFCPQYVVFGRIAFLCTHVAEQKIHHLIGGGVASSAKSILNDLLRSISVPAELNVPNYPHYEHLLKAGEISLYEFLDSFQHLGSLDINQARLGEFSIGELYAIFGQDKEYEHGDVRLRDAGFSSKLNDGIASLEFLNEPDLKIWYTYAGQFMRLRERAKFELLKVLFTLKRAINRFARLHRLGNLIYYLELQDILKLNAENRDAFRLRAMQQKALFEACRQQKVKDVIMDFKSSPFVKNEPLRNSGEGMGYNFARGRSIVHGHAEGICLVAKSNEEYLKKLASYRLDGVENIIGIFKGVEQSYFNLSALKGFTTENGGYLSHAATIAREFHLPYITGINMGHFEDGDYVIFDAENDQIMYKK